MKNICAVNIELPTPSDYANYCAGGSLLDYDLVLFNPEFPDFERTYFSSGGSCISIDDGQVLVKAMRHWSTELRTALEVGKTVFFVLKEYEGDQYATGSTSPRKGERLLQTIQVNNYGVLPIDLTVRNAKGRRMKVSDRDFKNLFDTIKDHAKYEVVLSTKIERPVFTTNDGTNVLGGVVVSEKWPGRLVLIPSFDISGMTETTDDGELWSQAAITFSNRLIAQLLEIDKTLSSAESVTPKPDWLSEVPVPAKVQSFDGKISEINEKISKLESEKQKQEFQRAEHDQYSALLYETGKSLENVVEKSLQLLGYEVDNFTDGDIEIDHIIVSPEGLRMIGETEGKDNSAVGISKFRQLETNITEDFNRPEVEEPAKGVLFGNGYRLAAPNERDCQFTSKCLVNSKRLNTVLVQTPDLYPVMCHILDNPKDSEFKKECRSALETATGGIAKFPKPPEDI